MCTCGVGKSGAAEAAMLTCGEDKGRPRWPGACKARLVWVVCALAHGCGWCAISAVQLLCVWCDEGTLGIHIP